MEKNHHLLTVDDSPVACFRCFFFIIVLCHLIYITTSCPDIAYVVHVLAQFMATPKACHLQAVFKLLRYIKGTCSQGLFLSTKSNLQLSEYYDLDWVVVRLLIVL